MRGLIAALAVVALLVGGVVALIARAQSRPYEVTAYVVSAAQVVPGNDVVLGGVPVGAVSAVDLAPDDGPAGARITMRISARYAPLHRGTRVTIRPKGLLGNMFVELAPDTSGPGIPSGGTIPVQDTAAPVTLDQVTDIFDAQTRQALQTLNRQGGVALQDRGPDVNHALQRLPQVSADLADTAGALDDRDQELDALAVEFDRVASQVAGEDRSLRGDIQNGSQLLDTLAAHQQRLQDELVAANGSLSALNGAVGGHEEALNELLKEQPALLDELNHFEGSATTTFATVDPCVNDLFNTLSEIRSATDYQHPAGSTDGNGFMLRVDPQLVGATNGSLTPTARCSG
ncbi:MAG TPA: MlaD family protein [Candidatus Dormibacteraeota bacterium]|jgi:virulence factor Mce-like protein